MWETTTKTMSLSQNASNIYIENVEVSASKRSSIEILWRSSIQTTANILGYRVQYQKVDSSYIQYGPHLPPLQHLYNVQNLVPDTYYNICLSMSRKGTSNNQKCITASTQSWDLPVSVGSSIGAVLALAMIVMVILLIRCRSAILCKRKPKPKATKYDAVLTHNNEDLYEFSPSVTQGEHANTVAYNEPEIQNRRRKQSQDYVTRNQKSVSGAIPKIPRATTQDHANHECRCKHNKKYKYQSDNPNGHIQQKDKQGNCISEIGGNHDHYHDNSIILHVSGNAVTDHAMEKEVLTSNNSFKCSTNTDKSLYDNNTTCSTVDNSTSDKLKMLLAFPNADSSSESIDNNFEMSDLSEISTEGAIGKVTRPVYFDNNTTITYT
jgi:hypothetical protein